MLNRRSLVRAALPMLAAGFFFAAVPLPAQDTHGSSMRVDVTSIFRMGADRTEAVRVTDSIHQAVGFGNTFMVLTDEGNVVVDTSLAVHAPRHKRLLQAVSDAPVRYIILTHGHADHTGGVRLWTEEGTEIIAQENHREFIHYQDRLAGFFRSRNEAQFAMRLPPGFGGSGKGNFGGKIFPTILFDKEYVFELGGVEFQVLHTPGETYDHATVWIPSMKAVFVGDNFYDSFPNIYTLRGTKPRWALDYVASIDRVLALEPEVLLPSHGDPILGKDEIARRLIQYRDAILHVHDATVSGMNEGRTVYELMQEITLPEELDVGEAYGAVAWSVRGIYEGYVGWYDGNPSDLFSLPASSAYGEVVELAGGPGEVADRASEHVANGDWVRALHLTDMALAADPEHEGALRARLAALEALMDRSENANEHGWLRAGVLEAKRRLADLEP